jgi:pyruvate kinase
MSMRRTKIIATLGPAVDSREGMASLVRAGADVVRINLSHGERPDHQRFMGLARRAADEAGRPVAVMVDLQGPRLRVGHIEGGAMRLEAGTEVLLTSRDVLGAGAVVPVGYDRLERDLRRGARVLIDDATIECKVVAVTTDGVRARVLRGGVLKDHKGINLPDLRISAPSVTKKDMRDIAWAARAGADYIAVSFVRDARAVNAVRHELRGRGSDIPIVAKVELRDAVESIEGIVDAADAVMVARGDLGIELPLQRVPIIQKRIVSICNRHAKPSIIATQMLESMTESPRPTRAEVSDVANAILDGTDAVMLSGETAVGRYPAETVATMATIAEEVEASAPPVSPPLEGYEGALPIPVAVARSAVDLAKMLEASALITFTSSGFTARHHSAARPGQPILAVSPNPKTVRRMSLYWGVRPALVTPVADTEHMIERAKRAAVREGLAGPGSIVVIASKLPLRARDSTNLIQVQRIERPSEGGGRDRRRRRRGWRAHGRPGAGAR